jgi:trehalose 6-phosphate phosphatase
VTMGVSSRRGGPSILLFLDYDGTLVSFKDTPLEAVLSPARKALLRRLAGKLRVCIVTGRSLAEIRRFVGLEELAYIGNHGLEMTWDGRAWVHPGALRLKPLVQDALRRIDARSAGWEGRLVENKGLTGSVHYRLLGPTLRKRMFRVVRREVEPAGRKLKIVAGAKVWEIRPGIARMPDHLSR